MAATLRLLAIAAATTLLAGCAARPPAPVDARAELMAADIAFAEATAARGMEGWMSAYAADAVRLAMGGAVARGRDEIREFDAALFADPAVRLTWSPTDGGAFGDGRTGFTTGRAAMIRAPADTVWRGAYVTLWQRAPGGRWMVILDTGASD